MAKRLVLCCDGTWNTPDQRRGGLTRPTNVVKAALAIAPSGRDGREQRTFYHRGVGTDPAERIRGGAFGFGLSRNVREVYRFLVQHYEPGDELFFLGFSRGAYTARSTVGFIHNCGILRREHANRVDEAYQLYRSWNHQTRPRGLEAKLFRQSFSHPATPVRFVGVWDTVGALGIPLGTGRLAERVNRPWQFHNTDLGPHVKAAFQALAIDEQRGPFRPAIWHQSRHAEDQRLEQVWFAGTHSDVGGGNPETGLSDLALLWMADRARECGLEFRPDAFGSIGQAGDDTVVAPDPLGALLPSRTGFYRLVRRHVREIGAADREHEDVSPSAVKRHQQNPGYAPANLLAYLEKSARSTGSSAAERLAS